MTKLYISEFSKIASDANGNVLHFPGVPAEYFAVTPGSAMKIAAITTT